MVNNRNLQGMAILQNSICDLRNYKNPNMTVADFFLFQQKHAMINLPSRGFI